MTAAHCTNGKAASQVQVVLGEHDKTTAEESNTVRMDVSSIVQHPSYAGLDYDFSLLRLNSDVNFNANPHIRPVCLPVSNTEYLSGDPMVVSGWGRTTSGGSLSDFLQEVTVNYISTSTCNVNYGGRITPRMMCAAAPGKDSCQGDSGGPLVHARNDDADNDYELAGVVSWGYGCANPKYPGVYARITAILPWITATASGSTSCPAA